MQGPMGLCRQIGFRTLIRRQLFLQLEELTQKKQTPQLLSIFKLLSTTSSFVPAGATQFSDNILVTRAYASKAMTAQERRILRKIDPKLATQSEVVVFRRIVVGHVIVAGRLVCHYFVTACMNASDCKLSFYRTGINRGSPNAALSRSRTNKRRPVLVRS